MAIPLRTQLAQDGQTAPPEGAEDRGVAEHWESPDYDDSSWDEITVPGTWEDGGFPDLDGYGWYRLDVTIPQDLAGKRILLSGDSLDDTAWIYVNGRMMRHTKSWNETFLADVTGNIHTGQRNSLVLRIFDNNFLSGVRGHIRLISPDIPAEGPLVLDRALRALDIQPEVASSTRGIVRRLMTDGAGNRHLLYTNETDGELSTEVVLPVTMDPTEGELMDLLEGERFPYKTRNGDTVVSLSLDPNAIGILPLRPIP